MTPEGKRPPLAGVRLRSRMSVRAGHGRAGDVEPSVRTGGIGVVSGGDRAVPGEGAFLPEDVLLRPEEPLPAGVVCRGEKGGDSVHWSNPGKVGHGGHLLKTERKFCRRKGKAPLFQLSPYLVAVFVAVRFHSLFKLPADLPVVETEGVFFSQKGRLVIYQPLEPSRPR